MFLLYSLLFSLGVILAAPYYLWRHAGRTAPAPRWAERFGHLPQSFQQLEPRAIWVHAVSVGETLAVVGLVQELQAHNPGRKIFLSHVTPAGREAGEKRLPTVAGRFYLPLDWAWCVQSVLDRIRPALLLIVETELWPNLLRGAHAFGAQVMLVNARISDRSLSRYRMFRPFIRRVLENVDGVSAQTERDAERFLALGASPERVRVTGNLKFDFEPPKAAAAPLLIRALGEAQRRPVMVAASTMPGEEALLLEAWAEVRRRHSRALLILAPRHPARFDGVAELLDAQRRTFVRRTTLNLSDDDLASRLALPEILLLDTIGELAAIFELADVVFMGGSLVPSGGHNLLEPAFWGKPILFGPNMENFRDIARLFKAADAVVEVHDSRDLAREALALFDDEKRRRQLGEKAKQVLERASGATRRVSEHIRELLEAELPIRAGV